MVDGSDELHLKTYISNSLVNPVELISTNYSYVITGREKPHFYSFGQFTTTQDTCQVLETKIYAYKNKTVHEWLTLEKSESQWLVYVMSKELIEV